MPNIVIVVTVDVTEYVCIHEHSYTSLYRNLATKRPIHEAATPTCG